jgi:hypothetical protein
MNAAISPSFKKPAYRKLRGYAFDPSLSLQVDTVDVNNITYKIEWEDLKKRSNDNNATYPAGEYIEVVDYDPASACFYPPVDLNDQYLLAQDGLDPSVSNPQFHQQMVYAVVMTTIKNFERALGRKIQWAEHVYNEVQGNGTRIRSRFVERLRIYPHALRQANAYYNPIKKALLFGYFPAAPVSAQLQLPGGTVFTCLSHDIIAHETTHAILDGLHRRYIEPTHPDTRAFHEAFSDIVALFQHFTFPDVLKQQIAKTKGDLIAQNLLGQLAQEFGKAMGGYGGLRDFIGSSDPVTGEWKPHVPRPDEYNNTMEFHDRGAILVAAVFDAFLTIYKSRIQSLKRLASGGTGILPAGDIPPDLVDGMANAAARTASHILSICVRALDYCPPVDITFGDYLRGILTADRDLVAEDERDYRIAFIEAFQKRGIFPRGIKSMSVEALCHEENPRTGLPEKISEKLVTFLRDFKNAIAYLQNREGLYDMTKEFIAGGATAKLGLHDRLDMKSEGASAIKRFSELTGLQFYTEEGKCRREGFHFSGGTATYQVDKLWLANRVSPTGKIVNHVIVTLVQQRGVLIEAGEDSFKVVGYYPPSEKPPKEKQGFIFRGGCTLIFDLDRLCLRYAIRKSVDDVQRMEMEYRYNETLNSDSASAMYFDEKTLSALSGPFAFMHGFGLNH